MGGMQWVLEGVLIVLLAATLFHALRLERALGLIKRDRAGLEDLVHSFNESTRQAESGIERLRGAAEGAGRHIARQVEAAALVKGDMEHLIERGDHLADRLDALVRAAREREREPGRAPAPEPRPARRAPTSMAEAARPVSSAEPAEPAASAEPAGSSEPRVRSQAERDLLRALRVAR